MTNLATLLEAAASQHPDRVAILSGRDCLTFEQLNEAANQVANFLVLRGVKPGDKVALSCPNGKYFTAAYYGILKAGGAVVPLNVMLKAREIAYHLTDSDANAYIVFEGDEKSPIGDAGGQAFGEVNTCTVLCLIPADPAAGLPWDDLPRTFATVDVDDDDTAVIIYTSGTTGQPKGAELRHRNLRDNALVCRELFGIEDERPDTYLCVLPLYHSFAQTCVQNAAIAFGGTVVMLPRFDAREALVAMLEHGVTIFAGVPTMYWGLLNALDGSIDSGRLAATLRLAASGGAALPVEVHKDFKAAFGVTILEGFGMSEGSPTVMFAKYGQEPRVGSIGVPIPGVQVRLIDDNWVDVPETADAIGEIAFKGHNVMKGYYGRPEETADALRDGWLRSGDLARKDADGYYYIVDRSKDMILRGGYNVYPREIEEVLMTHPAVSLVAVLGVPHESHGEEIEAVVVKNAGYDDLTEQDLIDWCRQEMAAYKYPRRVEFRDELPLTATGKILKRAIRAETR